jgi:two-component system response regulator (stage 0 sporulation protein F)
LASILLIEDDQQIRGLLRQILEDSDHDIFEASDGDEGIAAYRTHRPDLVISDIVMPNKDGLMAIQEILQEDPGASIICISGGPRGKKHWLPFAKKAGAIKILKKPISPVQLIEAVDDCLSRRATRP